MQSASLPMDMDAGLADANDRLPVPELAAGWVAEPANEQSLANALPISTWVHVGTTVTPARIEDFFADAGLIFDHTVSIWDPQCLLASDVLERVPSTSTCPVKSTQLRTQGDLEPLAVVHHRWVSTAGGRTVALVHIQDRPGAEAAELDVALGLVESSGFALITRGSGRDREVLKRLDAFCRQAAWRGPRLHVLSLRRKSAGSDRVKRPAWPRSMRTRFLEYNAGTLPMALGDALRHLDPGLTFASAVGAELTGPTFAAGTSLESVVHPSALRQHAGMNSVTERTTLPSRQVGELDGLDDVLMCAALCPGVSAVWVLDLQEASWSRVWGDEAQAVQAAASIRAWLEQPVQADHVLQGKPLTSVQQGMLCVAMPLPAQAGRFLVGLGEPLRVEERRLVWQLKVALNASGRPASL